MISRERIFYLADRIIDRLIEEKITMKNSKLVRSTIIKKLTEVASTLERIDEKIRRKISSSSKTPPEGSPAWFTLYERYLEEELNLRIRR